jgi:hypothetical protein
MSEGLHDRDDPPPQSLSKISFDHGSSFERGEVSGNLRLGKFEMLYEEMFAEVIEDGIITPEERQKLDKMADQFGLDRQRLRRLEQALQAAWEARHKVVIRDISSEPHLPEEDPRASVVPLEPATDQRTLALERRVKFLEQRIRELESELREARSNLAVEVDLSDIAPAGKAVPDDDPVELQRRVRHDPHDVESLRSLFRIYAKTGDPDRRWLAAHVLAFIGQANDEERAVFAKHRETALIKPLAAVTGEGWTKLLFHPEEEPLVGEILSVVVSAVLIGRLSAMRRDKTLPRLDAAKKQDPATSTIQAVRCFNWAAAILGMASPPLFVDPDYTGMVELVPAAPPAARLGQKALSGRSAAELAFMAGRHLACHRAEHFVKMLLDLKGLEEVFLAALSIGNPGMPLAPNVKQMVVPLAKAIEPVLEPAQVDTLRGQFLRFVEEGGRANLQRWAAAVDKTCCRAGLLLSNDLRASAKLLELDDKVQAKEKVDDLIAFMMSDRYAKLRKQIGIAIAAS